MREIRLCLSSGMRESIAKNIHNVDLDAYLYETLIEPTKSIQNEY